jgi:hypothetical protein
MSLFLLKWLISFGFCRNMVVRSITRLKKSYFLLIFLGFSLFNPLLRAQPHKLNNFSNPYKNIYGLSWSIINDNEDSIAYLFDTKRCWNGFFFPSRISYDKYIGYGWSFEGSLSYNKYKPGKLVNDTATVGGSCLALDANMHLNLNRYARGQTFDPFLVGGLGFTYRTKKPPGAEEPIQKKYTPTLNLALGTNIWVAGNIGIQLQMLGKLSLAKEFIKTKNNYVQYTVGLVYKQTKKFKSQRFRFKKHWWTMKPKKRNRTKKSKR